jgi:hypothetical protein
VRALLRRDAARRTTRGSTAIKRAAAPMPATPPAMT